MVDPDQVNEEDRLAIQQQKKSIYQVSPACTCATATGRDTDFDRDCGGAVNEFG